jgi:hypothetical protein
MRPIPVVLAAALAASLALAAPASAGNGHGGSTARPEHALVVMTNTGVDANATGRMDVKHFPAVGTRAERSWMRLRMRHLDRGATYTLWMDDPSTDTDPTLVQVTDVSIVTKGNGNVNFRIDTETGATLPFGSTLALLAGKAFEVRDAGGNAVLSGTVPTLPQ